MADIYARQSGNWNSTSTWDGGVIPSVNDDVYTNNFTVTVNTNAVCRMLTNNAGLSTAGGFFTMLSGFSLSAMNIVAGGNNANYFGSFTNTSPASCVIYGNMTANNQVQQQQRPLVFQNTSTGRVDIYGNVGDWFNGSQINHSGDSYFSNNTGIMNIYGNVVGGFPGTNAYTLANVGNGTVNIFGNVFGSPYPDNSSSNHAILNSSTGQINVSGSVYGNDSGIGIVNSSSGTVSITGNVFGGRSYTGISNSSSGIIRVFGNVLGSLVGGASVGITNSSSGSAFVFGTAKGGRDANSHGVSNTSNTGFVFVSRALGNGFGAASQGATDKAFGAAVGLANSAISGRCFVEQIECGSKGQFPVTGNVYLSSTNNSIGIFKNDIGGSVTLYPLGFSSTYTPPVSDVRLGIMYDEGKRTGTLNMPLTFQVNFAVPMDNTVGEALFDSNAVFGVRPSNIRYKGSIGERISRVATISGTKSLINNLT